MQSRFTRPGTCGTAPPGPYCRYALPPLAALAAQASAGDFKPLREVSICYYKNVRGSVEVATHRVRCLDLHQAKFTPSESLYSFNCGVTNAFNAFGAICNNACGAALRGVANYALHGKTVVYGPPLALAGPGGFVAFSLVDGSCDALRVRVQNRQPTGLEPLRDDTLIGAADMEPPARR